MFSTFFKLYKWYQIAQNITNGENFWQWLPLKRRSSDHSFGKYAKLSEKLTFPTPDMCTCAYQGLRYVSFSENFAYILNEWSYNAIRRSTISQKEFIIFMLRKLKVSHACLSDCISFHRSITIFTKLCPYMIPHLLLHTLLTDKGTF